MKTPMTIKALVLAITIAFPLLLQAQARFVPGHTFAPANVPAGADMKACVNNLFDDSPVHLLWLFFRANDSSKPIATKELILKPKQGNCALLKRDILHQPQADPISTENAIIAVLIELPINGAIGPIELGGAIGPIESRLFGGIVTPSDFVASAQITDASGFGLGAILPSISPVLPIRVGLAQ